APAARMDLRVVVEPRGGADVHFPIEILWRRFLRRKTAGAAVVTVDVDERHLAELAAGDVAVAGFDEMGRAAALQADLHRTAGAFRRGDHRLAFGDVDADWLLAVNVG